MEDKKANAPIIVVTTRAFIGMPRRLTFCKNLGACPSFAIDQSIRVEAYNPDVPHDKTEVKITAFITEAVKANPAFSNTRVNGLTATLSTSPPNNWLLEYGIIKPMTAMAPM